VRIALSLVVLASVALATDLDRKLVQVDAKHARAFVKLAQKAIKLDQKATARMLYERALALDPSNAKARRALGYKRVKGEWDREREAEGEVGRWRDTDRIAMGALRAERRHTLEGKRTADWIKTCAKDPTRLKGLLRYSPRDSALHAALGHKNGVRPELEKFAATMRERLAKLRACAAVDLAEPTKETVVIAGLRGNQPVFRVGERRVASSFPVQSMARFANKTQCVQSLFRLTLGDAVKPWDEGPVYFLGRNQYRDFLAAQEMSDGERAAWMKRRHYWGKRLQVFGAKDLAEALDFYAHAAAVYTIGSIRDAFPESDPSRDAHPWLIEGYGLFVTLELFDTAETFLTSGRESTGKIVSPLPPPTPIRRASALAHIRDELYFESLPSLRELLGSSMNGLDKVRSVQAWTFVRFLLLYDPDGFKKLPGAMRAQKGDSRAERSALALRAAFGVDAAKLERLWRLYLLELA